MMDADTDRRIRDSIEANGRVDIIDRYGKSIGGSISFGLLIFSTAFVICMLVQWVIL